MKLPPVQAKPRRRRFRLTRIVIYSLLVLGAADYFLFHPARVTHEQLPPVPDELKTLAARLHDHVDYLASPELKGRKAGTPGNKAAERYLINQFIKMGLSTPDPEGSRVQEVAPEIGNNVFSALTPIDPSRRWLVLGAHFDHLGEDDGDIFLGADDNAGSVAILLETGRILQESSPLKNLNVLLVGFNSEEPPYFLTHLMGSNQFVMRVEETGVKRSEIQLGIFMDLMGGVSWKPLQDTVFAIGSEKSPELEALLHQIQVDGLDIRHLGLHMVESIPSSGQTPFSDYDAFRNHKIPFLFLSSGRTPDYHRATDTAEKLHYARMARTVLWLVKLIRGADQLPGGFAYHGSRENYVKDFYGLNPMIQKASRWAGKIPGTGLVSLLKLKRDRARLKHIQAKIHKGRALNEEDAQALSLASIRLQCLLGNMGPCFLLPATN